MPKRFHDTEIWKQDWFLGLPTEYKTLWLYIKDTCDHAGIWKPEKRFAEFVASKPLDFRKALALFNSDKNRVDVLSNGRWLLLDFIVFQYGPNLNTNNRVHASVLRLLEVNGVNLGSIRGLLDPKDRVKDKDKDKDKDKVKDVDVIPPNGFDTVWARYPDKSKRKMALRHYNASIKTMVDFLDIQRALDNYLKSERVRKGYVQNGSTWFNDWQSWVSPTPDMMGVRLFAASVPAPKKRVPDKELSPDETKEILSTIGQLKENLTKKGD